MPSAKGMIVMRVPCGQKEKLLTDEYPAFAGFSFSAVNFAINSIY